ncbi:Heparan-alpha-glucosaminide N-acetyltransferase [Balamuthia mandrillaris]
MRASPLLSTVLVLCLLLRFSAAETHHHHHSNTTTSPPRLRFGHQVYLQSANALDVVVNNRTLAKNVDYNTFTGFFSLPAAPEPTKNDTYYYNLTLLEAASQKVLASFPGLTFALGTAHTVVAFVEVDAAVSNISIVSYLVNTTRPKEFGMDKAKVQMLNLLSRHEYVTVLGSSSICHDCLYLPVFSEPLSRSLAVASIDTNFEFRFHVMTNDSDRAALAFSHKFDEYGTYTIFITDSVDGDLVVERVLQEREGVDSNFAFYMALCAIFGAFFLYHFTKFVVLRCHRFYKRRQLLRASSAIVGNDYAVLMDDEEEEQQQANGTKSEPQKKNDRIRSLDAFRGLSIVIMIFVNYGGGGYYYLNHSIWNGLTVADLVFPWFIWIMGTSMALSFNTTKQQQNKANRWSIFLRIVRRSIILFGLGLWLNNGYDYKHWRILGVLQRFGVAYFVVGCIALFVPKLDLFANKSTNNDRKREEEDEEGEDESLPLYNEDGTTGLDSEVSLLLASIEDKDQGGARNRGSHSINRHNSSGGAKRRKRKKSNVFAGWLKSGEGNGFMESHFRDILPYCFEWLIALSLLLAYLLITFLVSVPDCGRGYLGPGGIGDQGRYQNCPGGVAGYIDRKIFGERHIFQSPTSIAYYHSPPYDPEGALGNLTSIFLVFMGLQAGRTMVHYRKGASLILRWVAWGIFFGSMALLLCKGQQNDGWIPVNKNLWSPSFIFATGGGAFVLLAFFFVVIDGLKWWGGAPLSFVGMNPIVIYLGHEALSSFFPFSYQFYGYTTHTELLVGNLIGVTSWVLIGFWMYWHDFFISV